MTSFETAGTPTGSTARQQQTATRLAFFIAGFCIVGGQPAVNALAASYYPTTLRSTGIGWSLGVGRIGSIIGPVLGGELIRLNWPNSTIFLVVAIPAIVSAVMVFAMRGGPQAAPAKVAA